MDTTIADLVKFNESLDSKLDIRNLNEEFITSRQVELDNLSKNSDTEHLPFIVLSYAKLMELTVLLAGTYADNCKIADFSNLVVTPRHIDVCILNSRLIKEDYGITENIPLWFKKQVHKCIDSQYSEDLGRMVVDPSLLFNFVEQGLLLRIIRKERHKRLSDQFRDCIPNDVQLAFSQCVEGTRVSAGTSVTGFGSKGDRVECLDVASWLASSTVLNIVKGSLRTDLINVLRKTMSEDYLKSVNIKFEKAHNSLDYVNTGRKTFVQFPYDEGIPVSEWNDINQALCHFTLDGYDMIQAELDKSLSNPYYKSPFLKGMIYH